MLLGQVVGMARLWERFGKGCPSACCDCARATGGHPGKPWGSVGHIPPLRCVSLAAGRAAGSFEGRKRWLITTGHSWSCPLPNPRSFQCPAYSSRATHLFLYHRVSLCDSSCKCCHASVWFIQARGMHRHKWLFASVTKHTGRTQLGVLKIR